MTGPLTSSDLPLANSAGLRFLVVDGNTQATNDRLARDGRMTYGELYAGHLRDLTDQPEIHILTPSEQGAALPKGMRLEDADGVFWTGSALNFYDGGPEIENQLALSKAVFDAGVPYLGLCWGLQIAAVAAGGTVRRNPQGREAILASGLHATEAGRTHPLLSGRSGGWSAFAVHLDEVETLPPDCTVLAHNGTSAVQAAEIRHGKGVFWGVQYHPDLDCGTMAHICRRMEPELVAEGTFVDSATTASAIDALEALHSAELEDGWPTDPDHAEKAKILGLTRDTLDAGRRRLEITNWLRAQVLPRKGQ